MKWFIKIVLGISILALAATATLTLYFFNRISRTYEDEAENVFSENPKYHFSLILDSLQNEYWSQYKQGVFDAAREANVIIEFNPPTYTDSEAKMIEYVDIAEKAMLDGIIINGVNSEAYSEAITNALENGMSIVLAGDEPVEASKLCYVGTNFYEFGVEAAGLISQIGDTDEPINVAVIFSGNKNKEEDSSSLTHEHIMLNGLNSAAAQTEREINFVTTLYRQSELLGAEDLTRDILNEYKDIDVIFCTNAKDTLAAAKVLVERNLVGEVFIVGTNVNAEIKSMIEKGIVYGVLNRNGYKAGERSVEALANIIEGQFQSSFIDIELDIYTVMNIHKYKEN